MEAQQTGMSHGLSNEWLSKFNEKMQRQKRNVTLLLDNATCYVHAKLNSVTLFRIFSAAHDVEPTVPRPGNHQGQQMSLP